MGVSLMLVSGSCRASATADLRTRMILRRLQMATAAEVMVAMADMVRLLPNLRSLSCIPLYNHTQTMM